MHKIALVFACLYPVSCFSWRTTRLNPECRGLPCQNQRHERLPPKDDAHQLQTLRSILFSRMPTVGAERLTRRSAASARQDHYKNTRLHEQQNTLLGFSPLEVRRARSILSMSGDTLVGKESVKRVISLNNESFLTSLNSVERIAVIKFFAPWCRTCKALAPQFESLAEQYEGSATFFEVDFSQQKQICKDQKILVLPTILLYVPGVGIVDRFTWKRSTALKFKNKLSKFLASGNAEQLRALNPDVLTPLVRFKELYGSIEAIRKAPGYLQEKERWLTDRQREELQQIFRMLDSKGDGIIDDKELEAVCLALETGVPKEKLKACNFAPEELFQIITAADGDDSTHTVDETAFLRLMAQRAKDDVLKPFALLDIFEALDTSGNGLIDVQDLAKVLTSVNDALGDSGAALGVVRDEELDALLRAFDLKTGAASVDYEAFVSMLAGRGMR